MSLRVFYIGSVAFSRAMLTELLKIKSVEIVGIATKSQSLFNADHSDLSDLALENNIPYKYMRDINTLENVNWIKNLKPKVIFCFGWSSLIKKELLQLTVLGVIGYHPAKLPMNRGRHPIIWALALGLDKTASTFFIMDEGADSGDIINQKDVLISKTDTALDLYNKLIECSKLQLNEFIPLMVRDNLAVTKQNDKIANYWRKRSKKDGEIDFRMSSETIFNLVRALTKPYVGAHFIYRESEIKVWSCEIGPSFDNNHEPGKILEVKGNNILVKTGDGSILLKEYELNEDLKIDSYLI